MSTFIWLETLTLLYISHLYITLIKIINVEHTYNTFRETLQVGNFSIEQQKHCLIKKLDFTVDGIMDRSKHTILHEMKF